MSNENTLNIQYVHESFQRSLKEDDDVIIDDYIEGYNELVKFLNLIGSVFSFVSSDVRSKIKIMEKHREGDDSLYFESFKKMMKYEKETSLHEKNGYVSGSRTMLRLHRGLDFIRLFLKRLSEAEESMNTCTTCQNSYNETLAAFHPWYIRKAATLAMHALPSRPDLLKKIFGTEEQLAEALNILPQTLQSCDEVYNRVEKLYTDFDFHGLP
ncbi:ceramide-1-phosphate transfer protein [Danaus plexippus]|uniref:Glycolipid transfer protein domain-containing protein 1 n=1 Tax=Danaus plexippus plexippus TaxID=278856 RepID=A0A212FAC5_DANPL|nr:ceramide-1-phosphate transfer protein [Danaus plexippus]OWR50694.1 Glycolipid transfer protein domain-containing protein 1 [Danaus plexippus plexippus]